MKQNFKNTQTVTTSLSLTQSMKNSLNVLKMNQNELIDSINDYVNKNPLIEYVPSVDMNQLIQDTFSSNPSLKDDLYIQLHTYQNPYDELVASFIIESLDDNGFLTETIDDYASLLNVDKEVVISTLNILQSFEPIGVASKNSLDSIKIQLKYKNYLHALHILNTYPKEIESNDLKSICETEKISFKKIETYLSQIRTCCPYPCSSYCNNTQKFIIPDFYISIDDKKITITPKDIGQIKIYNNINKNELVNPNLIEYFNDAHFFIESINKRNKTLLILANALIDIQKSHFLYNDDLEPCTLQDIADITGFHPSTVSRTLSNKYYEFENEIFPVKSLFSSKTKNGTGKDTLIKFIYQLIQKEDPKNPLSDDQIANSLEELGLYISRRGVAKYRNLMNIKNSKQRKK